MRGTAVVMPAVPRFYFRHLHRADCFHKWPAGETPNTDMTTGEERALNAKLRSICRGC